jgi:4-amino-4-deoxy-L-arabinose transferase-like glycosyltransferase
MGEIADRSTPLVRTWVLPAVATLILILAPLTLALTQAFWPRWIAVMALAWWLPGALLAAHWRLPELELPAASVFAIGLGLCWMILVALLVHWLPGAIGLWQMIAVFEAGALFLLVPLFWRRPAIPLQPTRASTWAWLAALLLLALILRLPGIGFHQFHTDEVAVLGRAARSIQGMEDALAKHAKGPGEIAVTIVVYRALGTINEATARMPFGLVSVASIVALALLGRRLFSSAVGFWAGVLFALNGFALGLSRIVQYQAPVLLLSALAVLAAWEFAQRGEVRWLALAATFSAFGLIMHYEFGVLAPALLALAWVGWRRAPDKRRVVEGTLFAGIAATLIVAIAYVPNLLNPKFAETQDYLGMRLGAFGAFNVDFLIEMGTFYNSIYFFVGLIALMLIGLFLGWRKARHRTFFLVLWFAPAFILHMFIMRFPGTHFYLLMESWSLLAALPLAAFVQSRTLRPAVRWAGLVLVIAWLAVSAGYLYLVFFRQVPQYLAHYDEARAPLYWAPYGDNVPAQPRFGFAIQEGWKALGTLAEWGYLGTTYASNERSRNLGGWYLTGLSRANFEDRPDLLLVAGQVEKPNLDYSKSRLEGYVLAGEVRVRDEPRLQLWARDPLPVSYVTYHVEDFDIFDQVGPVIQEWPDPPVLTSEVPLDETMTLESAGLAGTALSKGDLLHLLLVWRPQQSLSVDYKLFVHIADESGRPVTQWDGYPCLNTARTSLWPAGEAIRDHVLMRIPDDMPSGAYSLLVGLYDGTTGRRLGGQAIQIATITIR